MSGAETAPRATRTRNPSAAGGPVTAANAATIAASVTAPVAALLREQTEAAAAEGKTQLAAQVAGLARAVRRGGDQLYEDDLVRLARLSDVLADELEAAGHYLETRDSRDLLDELGRLLKQRGALVFGGVVVAGALGFYLAPKLRQSYRRENRGY